MLNISKYSDQVYKIIGAAMTVHSELSWGLLEPVYQEALHIELQDRGIENEREKEIDIYYKKRLLDKKYKMDIVVGDIIIELKSVEALAPVHFKQVRTYMKLLDKPAGLLVNFDVSDFRQGYKVIK